MSLRYTSRKVSNCFCLSKPLEFRPRTHIPSHASPCPYSSKHIQCSLSHTRRQILSTVLALPLYPLLTHAAIEFPELRGLAEKSDDQPLFRDLGRGVKIQDIEPGAGDTIVEAGNLVGVKYVMRRSNGYFIDASYGFDRFETYNFKAGSSQVVVGFDMAIQGMKIGGRRRFVVPPELGYIKGTGKNDAGPIPPDFGARRSLASHAKEPIIFEVQVVKIRS